MAPKQPVLLVDFNEFKPRDDCVCHHDEMLECVREMADLTDDEVDFITKIRIKSGLARDGTYLPHSIHPQKCVPGGPSRASSSGARSDFRQPRTDIDSAMEEAREVLVGAMEGLLHKTGLNPQDIDILVVTCSIFCPTPSMASMIINHFRLEDSIQSYHLGGMGCSNGVGSLKLVHDLLQARPGSNAVLLTTETVTPCYYRGKDKHRLVANILFRMGGAAMLMSNKPNSWPDAKYKLDYTHKVNLAASDDAYKAIWYGPDSEGHNGIYLGKNVVTEASKALNKAMHAVGPHVLTLTQKAKYVANVVERKIKGRDAVAPYNPAFSEGVQHFLLHAGGAKVLDGLGKGLQLTEHYLEPSRAVLHDYGNVSSSTTWYTLGYIETVRGVKQGDKVLQVGVGSGIKCAVAVWKALRDIKDPHEAWEHRLPEQEQAAARAARSRPAIHVHMPRIRWTSVLLRVVLLMALLVLHMVVMARMGATLPFGAPTLMEDITRPFRALLPNGHN